MAVGAAGLILLPVALLRGLRAGPGELGTLLGDTRAGAAWWVQLAALAAAAVAALAIRSRGPSPPAGAGRAVALGLPPAVALMAISWAGHASTGADRTVNIVIDGLHGLATAAWLGGLVGLAVLAIPATRALGTGDRVRLGAGVVVRFSALALVAVGVLVVTGVYRALAELELGGRPGGHGLRPRPAGQAGALRGHAVRGGLQPDGGPSPPRAGGARASPRPIGGRARPCG